MASVTIEFSDGKRSEAETSDVPPHLEAEVFGWNNDSAKVLVSRSFQSSQFLQSQALCA